MGSADEKRFYFEGRRIIPENNFYKAMGPRNKHIQNFLPKYFGTSKFEISKIKTKTKTETKRGKRPTGGGGRGRQSPPLPLAGSPAFVSVFVFVFIFDFANFDFPK